MHIYIYNMRNGQSYYQYQKYSIYTGTVYVQLSYIDKYCQQQQQTYIMQQNNINMIITDLEQNIQSPLKQQPKIRKEYSGGFRNYHVPHTNILSQRVEKIQSQPTIQKYIGRLNVQNLSDIYHQVQIQNDHTQQEILARQMQSVNRLYHNNYTHKIKQQQQSKSNTKNNIDSKFATDVYRCDPKYSQHAKIEHYSLTKCIQKAHHKLISLYNNQYKNKQKLLQPPVQFTQIIVGFIITCAQQILKMSANKVKTTLQVSDKVDLKSNQEHGISSINKQDTHSINKQETHSNNKQDKRSERGNSKMINQQDIIVCFRHYLCQAKLIRLVKRSESLKIQEGLLEQLKRTSKFMYFYINHIQLHLKTEQTYTYRNLVAAALKNQHYAYGQGAQQIITQQLFDGQLINTYTKPLQVQFQKKEISPKHHQYQDQNSDDQQIKCKIKAAPIPQSTYKQPKTASTAHNKHKQQTIMKPFNLTETAPVVTADQYYHWDANFKAHQIPQTTYKMHNNIKLLTEQQKKAAAHLLLQQSSYPKTMSYLNTYKDITEKHRQQLASKHSKKYDHQYKASGTSSIPDWHYLHAKQLVELQTRKQKQHKQIDIRPFNLSVTRQRIKPEVNMGVNITDINTNNKSSNNNRLVANKSVADNTNNNKISSKYKNRSTKKYDAYIQHRKQVAQKQTEKQSQRVQQRMLKHGKQQKYRQILKQRMGEQLQMQAKPTAQYQTDNYANNNNKCKVDMHKIYWERPLLMESTLSPQQAKLPWQPIFIGI